MLVPTATPLNLCAGVLRVRGGTHVCVPYIPALWFRPKTKRRSPRILRRGGACPSRIRARAAAGGASPSPTVTLGSYYFKGSIPRGAHKAQLAALRGAGKREIKRLLAAAKSENAKAEAAK